MPYRLVLFPAAARVRCQQYEPRPRLDRDGEDADHGPMPHGCAAEPPVVLDRHEGPNGEVVLRKHGDLLQIIANGCFLMDTSDGRSERLLVRAAGAELGTRESPSLLIGGLGVGFSIAEAAADPRWGRITVVERESAIIGWHGRDRPLAPLTCAALRDARTEIVHADLLEYLTNLHRTSTCSPSLAAAEPVPEPTPPPAHPSPTPDEGARPRMFDAICLDIDNGPDWTVTENNGSLYSPAGLAACRARLTPGGVFAVWSARPSPKFEDALRNAGFIRVRTEEIRVVRGVPDVVHFAIKPA